jgi:hypothetical protein
MDYSEKINMMMEFADGSLDPGKEDALFLMLSSDDELRQQFKAMMSIKNAVRSGVGTVAHPESSKAAVFAALSLPLPNETTAPSGIFTKENFALVSGIAILFTALFFYFNIDNENVNNTDKVTQLTVNQSNLESAVNSSDKSVEIPNVSAKEISVKASDNSKNNLSLISEKQKEEDSTLETADIANTANETNIDLTESNIVKTNANTNLFDITEQLSNSAMPQQNMYNPMREGISLSGNDKFTIEFRGSSYRSTRTPTIEPGKYSPLNNMALSVAYNFDNNLTTGIDLRQETFFLRYEGSEDGEQFIYEQQPNFTTFSALFGYKLDGWGGLRPYMQVSAGVNSIGLVSRAMLGAEYRIFSNFALVLAVDFSNLTYTHQNNYFNSSKFGLNYGLSYSF